MTASFSQASLRGFLAASAVHIAGSSHLCLFAAKGSNGHDYTVATSSTPLTWHQAKVDAASHTCCGVHGHLASITSHEENNVVSANLYLNDAWIGLNDIHAEGTFVWTTGETSRNYTNWVEGHPSGAGADYDCAFMGGFSGLWSDRHCQQGLTAYAIEFDCPPVPTKAPVPLPTGRPTVHPKPTKVPTAAPTHHYCPRAQKYNGHLYIVEVAPKPLTAIQAVKHARSLTCCGVSGELASITTQGENQFLHNRVTDLDRAIGSAWIGLTRFELFWLWPTPEMYDYAAWAAGEPNNVRGAEDCVVMHGSHGSWYDRACTDTVDAFIVEFNCRNA